ncbi:MAG: hypothetical protein ACP5N3_06195 [Candidatus Nanoarchaeia archaeon]
MYLIPHALFGGVLAYLFGWWGVALAFLSHYLLDIIPHTHYSKKITHHVVIALIAVLAVLVIYIIKKEYIILIGAFAASIQDIDDLLVLKYRNKYILRYNRWHKKIQNETANIIGTLTQIAVVLFSIIMFYLF